jgi:endo-1,4-beta-xylanase
VYYINNREEAEQTQMIGTQRICLATVILLLNVMLSSCIPTPLPDLVWAGTITLDPVTPAAGNKFNIKQAWTNAGSAAISSEFDIRLEITLGNWIVFDQHITVNQPIAPGEGRTMYITPEYVIPEPGEYQIVLVLDAKDVVAESREDNNVAKSDFLEVNAISEEADMAALAQAKEDIEKYRKGDVIITIVDEKEQPCSGLAVEYAQTTHSFLFGMYWNIRVSDDVVWSLVKEAGINYVPVTFTWSEVEPEFGTYNLGADWSSRFHQFGFAGMGHCLIFLYTASWSTPTYVRNWSYEEYKQAVYPHIREIVNAYKGEIKTWNVFNEPMYANILHLTEEQTMEVLGECIRAVRDADPEARTLINNFDPASITPYDFVQHAVRDGVDFDIIGLEFYYNAGYGRRTLASMGELIDKYSALGKKIHITELSVPSEPFRPGQGYWGKPWSQELQSEYLVTAYTIFFSKPQVEAITWWDATDKPTGYGNPHIYHGALLDEQNQPKKSYHALKELIKGWTTTGTAITNEKGQITFRGFGGTYEVTITNADSGLSQKQQISIQEQKNNIITIVLD